MSRLIHSLTSCLFVLLVCGPAFARARFYGYAEQGGKQVMTGGVLSTLPKVQASYPGATVTVRNPDNSLATLYSDLAGTAKANPFVADQTGFWFYYADNLTYNNTYSGTGISTPFTIPVSNLSNTCTYDALYATLALAVASVPANGCLLITGPWTIPAAIVVTVPMRIQCLTRAILSIGYGTSGAQGYMFQISASNVQIDGCTLDGRFSQSGFHTIALIGFTAGVVNFTLTNSVLQNNEQIGLQLDNLTGAFISDNNLYQRFGDGTYIQTGDSGKGVTMYTSVFRLTTLTSTNDRFITNSCNNAIHFFDSHSGLPGGVVTFNNPYFADQSRNGVETSAGDGIKTMTFNHPVFAGWNHSAGAYGSVFSIVQLDSTPTHDAGLFINDMEVYDNASNDQQHGLVCECFSNNLQIRGGVVRANFAVFAGITGGGIIDGVDVRGGAYGVAQNFEFPSVGLKIIHSFFHEQKLGCILESNNDFTVDDVSCDRTPGYYSDDASTGYTGMLLGSSINPPGSLYGAANFLNNKVILNVGTIPAGFSLTCFYSTDSARAPKNYDHNYCWNKNTAAFGLGISGTFSTYNGSRITNTTFQNVATIGPNGSSYVVFSGNKSILNDGTDSSVVNWLIDRPQPFASINNLVGCVASIYSLGHLWEVTDSNTNTWGATVGAGGSNDVLIRCNSANHFTVVGK